MDNNLQLLTTLLTAAIHNQRPQLNTYKEIDWPSVFMDAKDHDVYALLYPILKDLEADKGLDNALFSQWQKSALYAGLVQSHHLQGMTVVLNTFNQAGIPAIALKGLVLRELYPYPDLRTMSDADLLVHEHDMCRAEDLLIQMGYYEKEKDSKHIHFCHKTRLDLELHKTLVSQDYIKTAACFENSVWKNAISTEISGTTVLMLSLEDQLIHLCLHMATHIICSGFGLRQLCDFVLFVESNRNELNWDYFYKIIEACDIQRFSRIIFVVCKQLFGLELPSYIYNTDSDEDSQIEQLLNDIFSGGVYGKSTLVRRINGIQLNYVNYEKVIASNRKQVNILTLLFPSVEMLGNRYSYARKRPFLTPIACIHRLAYNLFRKDYFIFEKLSFVFSRSSIQALDDRVKLLRWLGLR